MSVFIIATALMLPAMAYNFWHFISIENAIIIIIILDENRKNNVMSNWKIPYKMEI